MKRFLFFLLCALTTLSLSCTREDSLADAGENTISVSFMVDPMSDPSFRSAASSSENSIMRIALFAADEQGNIVESIPAIENPQSGSVSVTLPTTAKTIHAIANMDEIIGVSSLEELMSLTQRYANAPQAPFIMSGYAQITGGQAQLKLLRTIAKINVNGNAGFQVTSVTISNTPDMEYIFSKESVELPVEAEFVKYSEVKGSSVYVTENTTANPTSIFVKGIYKDNETAYTINLSIDGKYIDIRRNACYEVTITPITDTKCEVSVVIPEWDDFATDENYIVDFGTYMTADFHQHTGFSDGSHPIMFVLNQGNKYGLDIMVNSEHGGAFAGNASEGEEETGVPTWIESGLTAYDIKGDLNGSGANQKMWRWQSIKEYSYPKVSEFNSRNNGTLAIQGLEWNPPGHEHCSTGIITGQFDPTNPNANAMAQFEYMFDQNDNDQTGGVEFGWVKSTATGHEKSMEAARWLQQNHRYTSWMVPAHPERQDRWQIDAYRDLNDVAPDVFVAFESVPGHQASQQRGGIGNSSSYKRSYTFGGVGIQAAMVGGLWDAMISEGRNFWLVANSDYHAHVTKGSGDFYPGEYQKTYISMRDKTAQSFVDGLRSGNIYTVHGDLIDRLEFSVGTATMGQTFKSGKSEVKVRILVRDPETANHNIYTSLTNPVLDHIDLIAGQMRPRISKGDPEYTVDTYEKVKVIARFDATGGVTDANGINSIRWEDLGGGLKLIEYTVNISGDTYFRLRGTNNGLNVANRTDANGNPTEDAPTASVLDGAKEAFEDLWFYSNPVFVRLN